MTNFIVLVKQVPDVTQITDNAFDPQTGTLLRTRLPSVINELDTHALAVANHMKTLAGDKGARIVALTMGPPMAAEVLGYSLSRCADTAVLLTGKAFGGADTWATANPLAGAIRKIGEDIFNNDQDYFIISGMQSVDGDTAQVPAQIAEELKIPCIAYATDVELVDGKFRFSRIISGGSQIVSARKMPAVVTVAKYQYPLFATLAATRKANKAAVIQWGVDDIGASDIGVTGSKTQVIRVFPPGKTSRKCQQVSDVKALAEAILKSFKQSDSNSSSLQQGEEYILPDARSDKFDRSFEGTEKENEDFKVLAEVLKKLGLDDIGTIGEGQKDKILELAGDQFNKKTLEDMLDGLQITTPSYQGDVWVVAEIGNNSIHNATFELIGKARQLAQSLSAKVGVVVIGDELKNFPAQLAAGGADNVYLLQDKLLGRFDPALYRKVLVEVIEKYWPQIVLFAATPRGRVLAPMVSYRLKCGLTADCTSLNIKDSTRKGLIAGLLQTRPALGGNVMATISTKDSKSQMATARPGVMKKLEPDYSRKAQIIQENVNVLENDLSLDIIKTEMASGEVNLEADVIVSGGKGMQSRDNYEKLLGSLTDALGRGLGTEVERAASRAAVEQGFANRIQQVGQTGTSISPKIYMALGISGAIQHMIGVANSQTIIAVNNDPNAPIFKHCDYYIIGSVEDVISKLVNCL